MRRDRNRLTSSVGYSLLYSTLNNGIRPSSGERPVQPGFCGLGGDTRYLRTRASGSKYWSVFNNFIFSLSARRYIHSFEMEGPIVIRSADRSLLSRSPQIRASTSGVGPRIQRQFYLLDENGAPVLDDDGNPTFNSNPNSIVDDALGGRAYYLGRAELEIPLGSGARDLGLRPSIFADIGAVFGVRRPATTDIPPGDPRLFTPILDTAGNRQCTTGGTTPVVSAIPTSAPVPPAPICSRARSFSRSGILPGDTPSPRVSIGVGVNWNSPFGPFRIDISKALLSQPGTQRSSSHST